VIQQTVDDALEKRQQRVLVPAPIPFSADDADYRLGGYVVGHETFGQRNVTSSAPGNIAGAEGRVGSQLHACFSPIYAQKLFDYVQRLAASTLARITDTVKSPILATDKIGFRWYQPLERARESASFGETRRVISAFEESSCR
jgi:hypothetical protein